MTKKTVLKAIVEVKDKLSRLGIGKDQKNTFDKYNFRGIDDVYNVLSPVLAEAGLSTIPEVLEYTVQEVKTAQGGIQQLVRAKIAYHLIDAEGDAIVSIVVGEGIDRGLAKRDSVAQHPEVIGENRVASRDVAVARLPPTHPREDPIPDGGLPLAEQPQLVEAALQVVEVAERMAAILSEGAPA